MNSEAHAVHRGTTSDCERTRIEDKMDPNRYACTVLEEARAALAKLNLVTLPFSKRHLATLLEELQTIVNRMEAGLEDKSDYSYARDRLRETRAKLADLKADEGRLKAEIKALKAVVKDSRGTSETQEPNSTVHDDEDSSLKGVLQ